MPAFAEVQNVKVGGDLTLRGIHQENMDLRAEDDAGTGVGDDEDDYFMSTTGLNIGADLTENVSAFVRVANERDWNNPTGVNGGDIDLSQAYVTLKELFYSPLTVRVGTQPIVWGRGLVLGSNLLPTVLSVPGSGNDRHTAIGANQFTDFTAFDAIRATLDLSGVAGFGVPLTAEYVYIKLDENAIGEDDDVNIQGINLGSRIDALNSEVEAYVLNKRDKSRTDAQNRGSVSTLGLRGSGEPVEGSTVWAEAAYQFGKRGAVWDGVVVDTGSDQNAWAVNVGAQYELADVASSPMVGGEYVFFSGNDIDGAAQGWDPVAPGYFPSLIRAYQIRSGQTGLYPVDQTGVSSGYTNQHQFSLLGGLKPIEDLSVDSRLSWFLLADESVQPTSGGGGKRNAFLGTEWDNWVTYDYTDDVQLGLSYGLFLPGSVFRDAGGVGGPAGDATAQQLISTVSVKF